MVEKVYVTYNQVKTTQYRRHPPRLLNGSQPIE